MASLIENKLFGEIGPCGITLKWNCPQPGIDRDQIVRDEMRGRQFLSRL